jgi:hypothetical protein
MNVKVFDIKCSKCNQGVFKGKPFEEVCDHCGERISDELIESWIQEVSEGMKK